MLHTLRWPLTRIFYSLRWRLTGWYVLLLTSVLLLFSAGTYIVVYKLLLDNFDDLLASQANLIVQTVDFSDRNLTLQNDSLRAGHRDDEHLTRIYRSDRTVMYDDNPREQRGQHRESDITSHVGLSCSSNRRRRSPTPGPTSGGVLCAGSARGSS